MNRLLITAAALALLGAPAAFAQDQNQDHRDYAGQAQQQPQGGRQGPGGGQGGQGAARQWSGGQQPQPQGGARQWNGPGSQAGSSNGVGRWQGRQYQPQGQYPPQGQGQPRYQPQDRAPQQWNGGGQDQWRQGRGGPPNPSYQGGPRYDGQRYGGGQSWSQRRFRAPEYRWPRGYGYRRFSYGEYLPQIFFSEDYWLYDYSDYGLPYAPQGDVWVRYGPDALLIDRYTGQIVDVIYGVFY